MFAEVSQAPSHFFIKIEKRGTPEVSKTVRENFARRSKGTPCFRLSCKVPLFATKLPKLLRLS
jgi:hypothetical protein